MKKLLRIILFLLVCTPVSATAQSWTEVTTSGNYYFGEGNGESYAEADQQALAGLLSQISVNVSVNNKVDNKRMEKDGKLLSDNTTFAATINTISQGSLDSTQTFVLSREPYHIGRFIKKTDLNKIYAGRRMKIQEFIDGAERALTKGKIDVALKSYCWALALTKSMQFASKEQYRGHTLVTWIPERIDDILSDVKVAVTAEEGDEVDLLFTYCGKPVSSIDYTYNDGGVWSNLCTATDGFDRMVLSPGTSHKIYNINIELEYRGQAQIDPEVAGVLAVVPEMKIKRSLKSVPSKPQPELIAKAPQPESASGHPTASPGVASAPTNSFTQIDPSMFKRPEVIPASEAASYSAVLNDVVRSIKQKNYTPDRTHFTPNGLGIYNRLLKYGNTRVVGEPQFSFTRMGANVVARGLQLSFSFNGGKRKHFTENIVFTFNENSLIDNIAFGLDKTTEDDILGKSAFPEESRMLIVQFLENYKTAFALKRLDFIESIFDDNAKIITGTVIKTSTRTEDNGYKNDERIIYNRETKDSYLKKLARGFGNKEFINIRFNECQVMRPSANDEIYGIQVEQEYYSSNYSDHGYLMLAVNYTDPERPLIFVRTWQPEPDPDFGIYTIYDFPFIGSEKK